MHSDFLKQIVEEKRLLLEERKTFFDQIRKKLESTEYNRYSLFKRTISRPEQINLIAEIKKASPSKGMLRSNFDVLQIAKTYVDHGAAAISILTEEKHFMGKPGFVKKVSDAYNVPILTKDFIIDEGQIFEARFNGASAVLLITAILSDEELSRLMKAAHSLDLDCLVEIHDENELERAVKCDAEIIGINNRNLHTFDVDFKVCEMLIPKVPKEIVIVAESGIKSHEEVKRLKDLGAHAVLVGETFMVEQDIGRKVEELMHG